MSTRRKKYSRQAKNKAERYGTSDSDTPVQDTEHQQTMRIITRLSQKYLTTRATPGSTSQSSAFTETEEEYYGDEENSPDTTGQSDGSITSPKPHDAYDFDSNEGFSNPRLILSPVKAGQLSVSCKQTKQNRKPHSRSKKQEVLKKQQPKISTKTVEIVQKSRMTRMSSNQMSVDVSGNSSIKETPSQRQNLRKRKSNNTSDTASSTSVDTTLGSQRSSPRMTDLNKNKGSAIDVKRDSGVFISPPLRKRAKLGSGQQATSTPSSESRAQKLALKALEDSRYGYDTLDSPALGVSPVKRSVTPMSDYCSMSSSHFTSMDTSTSEITAKQGFPFVLQEELPKVASKVHKPKKAKEVSQKAIQWAEKMNKEFAELENFELSIEG